MSQAVSIDLLAPTALNVAGVPLEDALWLHSGRGGMSFVQALATERGNKILTVVRAYQSA